MHRITITLIWLIFSVVSYSQKIYSGIHFNDKEVNRGIPFKITETKIFYNSNSIQVDKYLKIFDTYGLLQTSEIYDENDKLNFKSINFWDTSRALLLESKIERWDRFGYTKNSKVYSYNKNGFLIEVNEFDANNNSYQKTKLVNDTNGNPIEVVVFDGNGNPYGKEIGQYYYDKNQVVTSVISNDDRIISTDTLTISFKNASKFPSIDKIYNTNGDLIKSKQKKRNGSNTLYEHEYIYDEMGNWKDEKIFIVEVKSNGKHKKKLNRHFSRLIVYKNE